MTGSNLRGCRHLRREAATELHAQVAKNGEIVLLKKYCEITGDTPHAVHNRQRRGQWVDGVHCHLKDGRRLWVNMNQVQKWVVNNP